MQTARLAGSANSSAWKQLRLESCYANISAGSLYWTKLTHTSRLVHCLDQNYVYILAGSLYWTKLTQTSQLVHCTGPDLRIHLGWFTVLDQTYAYISSDTLYWTHLTQTSQLVHFTADSPYRKQISLYVNHIEPTHRSANTL
jgi:hypothetical protein